MRAPGEVHDALLKAARKLTTPGKAPTLLELACESQVGFMAARRTVDNMRRSGVLIIVRSRVVDYRNRPVAEYSTPNALATVGDKACPLREVFASWRTPIV